MIAAGDSVCSHPGTPGTDQSEDRMCQPIRMCLRDAQVKCPCSISVYQPLHTCPCGIFQNNLQSRRE